MIGEVLGLGAIVEALGSGAIVEALAIGHFVPKEEVVYGAHCNIN